ncbi:MAG: DUF1015 domain-containing protein [Clostridia bacterium]|nr:DUF1015 domain-containing protein [Clostridia bacterium]
MKNCFYPADILMPDFNKVDGAKWSVIACDQHTSEPEYWEEAKAISGGSPTTLELILPEVYLSETDKRVPKINATMLKYVDNVLVEHKDSLIYVERTQSDGAVRRGLVGKIDLEAYDYRKGATSLVRATEGTVLDRIPPRVAVRRDAAIELPHVMVLIDDPKKTVIEPEISACESYEKAYDFELMLGGGHIKGYFVSDEGKKRIDEALSALSTPEAMKEKYGDSYAPLPFAVGDGNHSLASAKAAYEEIKAKLGDKALEHPSRYALVEIVNLHDEALKFEPIYRVMFGVSPAAVIAALCDYAENLSGNEKPQKVEYVHAGGEGSIVFKRPTQQLTVGTLQNFIDEYIAAHPESSVDYIHDVDSTENLAKQDNAIGFIFDGMEKDQLFKTVICDGALPRKTFSMGHSADKRYYLECRKIK